MEQIKAKTILTAGKNHSFWFGMDYNMNLYRGCCHGCIYCDSRSECYQIENFDKICLKENALPLLNEELCHKRKKGMIGIGAMSDPYNPYEKKLEITRGALQLIYQHGFGVGLDTKSDLILRDIDLLKQIQKKNKVIIKITITTPEDELSQKIEPNVCPSSRRFQAVKTLSSQGVFVGILMNPVLPFLTDKIEDIVKLVAMAHDSGAKFILTYLGVTLRDRQRSYYYKQLDQLYPNLADQYRQRYQNQYNCTIPSAKEKYQVFKKECQKYGILYRMKDIIAAYQDPQEEQLSLF